MSADGELRRAERSGDRAELVRAMVRAGLGREAVARCGLHVGDVVRRARNHRGDEGKPQRIFRHGQIGDEGRVAARDVAHRDQVCVLWPTLDEWDSQRPEGSWPSDVYTLDLVEPGDGEQVLAPQHLTAILTPAGHG